ncbi:MAG: RluA family pseudouridine synthase [Candidatus Eutrophobiaceae bacterium]
MTDNLQSFPVRQVPLDTEHAGRRVDNVLLSLLNKVPHSHIYRMLRKGEVRLNGRRVKSGQRIKAGDILRVPPVRIAQKVCKLPSHSVRKYIKNNILYSDNDVIVLDKPANIPAHGGTHHDYGVIEVLRADLPPDARLELVHRLDSPTSGCLLLAKSLVALRALHAQWGKGTVKKEYLGLLFGKLPSSEVRVDAPLIRINGNDDSKDKVQVSQDGKKAISYFRCEERFDRCTLALIRIETGRMHQIRAHAKHIGHPLAGDPEYGQRETNHRLRRQGLSRMFLHASRLVFISPATGKTVEVNSPLPPKLRTFLDNLKANEAKKTV